MKTSRITEQDIRQAAIQLVEEHGRPTLSMRELAERLGVKTPSLYNHVESMEQLLVEVCRYAVEEFTAALCGAMQGKTGDEAVRALAASYRTFAAQHAGLYRVIMAIPAENDEELARTAAAIPEPFLQALDGYGLTEEQKMHWQRILRSLLHGFASQEQAGYFSHFPADAGESYALAVECFLHGLHAGMGGGSVDER